MDAWITDNNNKHPRESRRKKPRQSRDGIHYQEQDFANIFTPQDLEDAINSILSLPSKPSITLLSELKIQIIKPTKSHLISELGIFCISKLLSQNYLSNDWVIMSVSILAHIKPERPLEISEDTDIYELSKPLFSNIERVCENCWDPEFQTGLVNLVHFYTSRPIFAVEIIGLMGESFEAVMKTLVNYVWPVPSYLGSTENSFLYLLEILETVSDLLPLDYISNLLASAGLVSNLVYLIDFLSYLKIDNNREKYSCMIAKDADSIMVVIKMSTDLLQNLCHRSGEAWENLMTILEQPLFRRKKVALIGDHILKS